MLRAEFRQNHWRGRLGAPGGLASSGSPGTAWLSADPPLARGPRSGAVFANCGKFLGAAARTLARDGLRCRSFRAFLRAAAGSCGPVRGTAKAKPDSLIDDRTAPGHHTTLDLPWGRRRYRCRTSAAPAAVTPSTAQQREAGAQGARGASEETIASTCAKTLPNPSRGRR
jgi:hypothetical protein